ncbi:hypothetical protein [Lysinibacter cavernae]|uniref:Uncharacterized protein n=1 Tax=Lysinibacter cavernae TaxID=1640652 RepID=A0A7X5R1E7_9MICO|nr:hypothetical protein [Lysinibacter cavernae]NIH53672.1 hypothetical protein [Lysinibacter cavernae]
MTDVTWPRDRYLNVHGALDELRTAEIAREDDVCWAEIMTFELEVWFPFTPDEEGRPLLAGVETALGALNELDNVLQAELEATASESLLAPANFVFTPANLTLGEDGSLEIGYYGDHVNSEFVAVFRPVDGGWQRV